MNLHRESDLSATPHSIAYELIDVGGIKGMPVKSSAITAVLGEPIDDERVSSSVLPLIITGYDPAAFKDVLQQQRGDADTALRPIAVAGIQRDADAPVIEQLADVVLSPEPDGDQLLQGIHTLRDVALNLQEINRSEDDEALRLLQFLESREQTLDPQLDPAARIAYGYPLAEALLDTSPRRLLDVLSDMSQHGVLSRSTVDRVHLCPDCHGYRVTVKELCPECGSPDVSMEVALHHFRCGYMAPESRFSDRDGYLTCPKCNQHLRHVGVEYNRPSAICVCGGCGYWAERPDLRAWCVECNRLFAPEDVKTIRVYRYALTADARRAARAGSWDPRQAAIGPGMSRGGRRRQRKEDVRRAGPAGTDAVDRADADSPEDARISSEASSNARAIADSDRHSRDVLRNFIGVSQPSQFPMALFTARVGLRGEAAPPSAALVHQTEQLFRNQLDQSGILARVGTNTFLLAIPESAYKRAPSVDELKHRLKLHRNVQVDMSQIDSQRALQLLDAEG